VIGLSLTFDVRGGLTAQVEEITLEIAERLLQANSLNRRISGPVVERYARDMKAGRWKLNGQTIKISSRGRLLDGHRRIHGAWNGKPQFDPIRRIWHGTTDWQKSVPAAIGSYAADAWENVTRPFGPPPPPRK
jgi:hypothetical protein